MKFNKLKILMIIFSVISFQNSIYSAEISKKVVSKFLNFKKLEKNILRAAVIIIPITIALYKIVKTKTVYTRVHDFGTDVVIPSFHNNYGRGSFPCTAD